MSNQSLLAEFANGVFLLALLFLPLLAAHRFDAMRAWSRLGEVLEDTRRRS